MQVTFRFYSWLSSGYIPWLHSEYVSGLNSTVGPKFCVLSTSLKIIPCNRSGTDSHSHRLSLVSWIMPQAGKIWLWLFCVSLHNQVAHSYTIFFNLKFKEMLFDNSSVVDLALDTTYLLTTPVRKKRTFYFFAHTH